MRNLPPELESALLGRHVVFVRGTLDEAAASGIVAQLLLLSRTAAGRVVEMYVDSAGGTLAAALTVYDMMQTLGVPVATTCVGTAGGAAVLVLAGGARGQRAALPHARVHLVDESVVLDTGRAGDLEAGANAMRELSARWRTALLKHLSVSSETLAQDLAAPRRLSATEAQALGLIDKVVATRASSAGLY